MTKPPQLIGGPFDGIVLPKRYSNVPVIQMPMTDGNGNFATYVKNSKNPFHFLFHGFSE